MFKLITTLSFLAVLSTGILAQARPVEADAKPKPAVAMAPTSFEAKYEGGMFGFSKKEAGTLRFDDENERLVFFGKDKKEKFSLPYDTFMVIYPQSRSVTSTTGNVVRHMPLPGAGLAGLLREKRRYLIVQFADADVDVRGVASFKLDNKALLESVIETLGNKAKMSKRGDAFYRPRYEIDGI